MVNEIHLIILEPCSLLTFYYNFLLVLVYIILFKREIDMNEGSQGTDRSKLEWGEKKRQAGRLSS